MSLETDPSAVAALTEALTYHRIDGDWLVTNKAFQVERQLAPA